MTDNVTCAKGLSQFREGLRVMMLGVETTGERATFGDGFANGLCVAIDRFDSAFPEILTLPLDIGETKS